MSIPCATITDAGLASLADCPRLKAINLTGTQISDVGLKHLAQLPITDLTLDGALISDAGLKELRGLHLRTLGLSRTQITNAGLREIAPHPLEYLDLRETAVTAEAIETLRGMNRLNLLACTSPPFNASIVAELRKEGCDVWLDGQ